MYGAGRRWRAERDQIGASLKREDRVLVKLLGEAKRSR